MKAALRSSVNLLPSQARHWIKHVPVLAGMQRWLVKRVLSGESFVHTINAGPAAGLKFEVSLPADKAIWAGTFETEFARALQAGVDSGDICYDIGGYRGYMTGVLALAGAAQVIAFEPLPENAKALERLAELNTDLPITIERLALGRSDGRAAFNVMPEQSMGKLSNSPFQIDATPIREIEVELARLDTLVFERAQPRPNLIKIDVEGAEVEVLAGAIRTLTECRPRVYLEAHSTALEQECTAQLVAQGYRVRRLEEGPLNLEDTRHLIAQPA